MDRGIVGTLGDKLPKGFLELVRRKIQKAGEGKVPVDRKLPQFKKLSC